MKNYKKPSLSPVETDDLTKPHGNVLSHVLEAWPDVPFIQYDGFNDCIIGVIERFGMEPILCYDKDAVIQEIQDQSLMTYEQAVEWFEVNTKGTWAGDHTPCFLDKC